METRIRKKRGIKLLVSLIITALVFVAMSFLIFIYEGSKLCFAVLVFFLVFSCAYISVSRLFEDAELEKKNYNKL